MVQAWPESRRGPSAGPVGCDAGDPQTVAVFRALQLGDLLCAVPALRALRQALPEARITLVGLPWAREFVSRFRCYLDDFMPFSGAPGMPERRADVPSLERFLAAAQARRFDLALQLHGSGEWSNAIVGAFKAGVTLGFFPPGHPPPSVCHLPYPDDEPEPRRLLRLLTLLGIEQPGEALEFPVGPQDEAQFAALRALLPIGEWVCLHAGASVPARRWRADGFAQVGDWLARQGLHVLLTGTASEAPLTAAVGALMARPSYDLAGRTTLGALALLLRRARLLVCNDTGVSHLAAAIGVPSVVVFTASSPRRWAPLDRVRHRAVFVPTPCRPCGHAQCPIGHFCAEAIEPRAVMQAAKALLDASAREGEPGCDRCGS